jgi:nitroreductase
MTMTESTQPVPVEDAGSSAPGDGRLSVTDAVLQRRSTRAFRSDPVPEAVVREILTTAARSPSGGNVQPWKVYALTGAPLQELIEKVAAGAAERGLAGDGDFEYDVYPPTLGEPYKSFRSQAGEDLYATLRIVREDKAGRMRQFGNNFRFFGAPVGLIICIDRQMGSPQWADVGMYLQSVMLLALEHGLATCPQEAWSIWHKTIRAHCNIPDELMVFCGVALGYPDEAHPTYQLRTRRMELEEFAVFSGFSEQK